eukprot:a327_3706.p2 GENE.a327_3706~~a327_3706.p2  ORF type:complete len:148 (-),score=62.14 a327_3706:93-512(-)
MVKFLKPGKVVIILAGRFAGRKAVIVKNHDDGAAGHQFGHAVVAGIDRYPLSVSKSMTKKRVEKRSRIKAFVKVVNYNHIMPTRYTLDVDFAKNVSGEIFEKGDDAFTKKKNTLKEIKSALQERYNNGRNKWFFTKLRF